MPAILGLKASEIGGHLIDHGWRQGTWPDVIYDGLFTEDYLEHPTINGLFYVQSEKAFIKLHPKGSKWNRVPSYNIIKLGDMQKHVWKVVLSSSGAKLITDDGLIIINIT